MRVGFGYDVHPLSEGRPLILGGVQIPSPRGLLGHSDADVLSHAIADAILGAAALGDLGDHFPPSDPRWEHAESLEFLVRAAVMVGTMGLRVSSVDSTLVLESPKIAPHRDLIREGIARALSIDLERVSVKATSSDGLGFVGRGEGAAAFAVAVLDQL